MKHRRRSNRIFPALFAAGLGLLPTMAAAHPGHYHPPGEDDEFDALTTGFLHPLTGMDHMVLAVAAGWLAFSWKGGKARLPFLTFLGSLALGSLTGRGFQAGVVLEIALSLTLVMAGLAFMARTNLRLGSFITATIALGFIHGFAHGSETAANVPFGAYASGFVAGTAALLGLGGVLHLATSRLGKPVIPRLAGVALIVLGSVLFIQAL